MNVLLLGSGGREHALAMGLTRDKEVSQIHCAPGNPGIAEFAQLHQIDIADVSEVVKLAKVLDVDLVIVGPELPLINGVTDALTAEKIPCFGPTKNAALIEGSKEFAKEIMHKAGVSTAKYQTCHNEEDLRKACVKFGAPYVIKHDGLASGKGVVVTNDLTEAISHGISSNKVVVEEFLSGPEFSLFGICDGENVLAMEAAQDYKRVGDGDQGLNTGGMGAYSPLDWVSESDKEFVLNKILKPVLRVMKENNVEFIGVLYAGLIKTADGIKVIEFNARFGDPETQVLIPRLKTPLGKLLFNAATKNLDISEQLIWSDQTAVAVVLAANGYPIKAIIGDEISLPANSENSFILHAGTVIKDNTLCSSGGRVLNIIGLGSDQKAARDNAYQKIKEIKLLGSFYRNDIAKIKSK
jgi:phosphoribosylamine---glycine ligase